MSLSKSKYGIVTPATLTANVNNYNFTGLSVANLVRLSSDASRNITGLSTQGTRLDRMLAMTNVGAQDIVLKHASGSSDAVNRFNLGADVTLAPGDSIILFYDITQSRWIGLKGASSAAQAAAIGPQWLYFGWRGIGGGAGANYIPIAPIGGVGAGGIDTTDPTDPTNYNPNFANYMPAGTLSDFYVYQSEGPGAGKTVTFSIRVATADPVNGIEVVLAGDAPATAGSDVTHTVAVAANALVAIKMVLGAGATGMKLTGRVLWTPAV